jgi:acyl-CoA synthetase (AMP-forming)/AMP-acid ligase II
VFPISPRNSAEAVVHLLRATSATLLFVTTAHLDGLVADVKTLLAERDGSPGVQIEELPDFADIFKGAGDEGDDDARLISALREPFDGAVEMYLHSSGSTGMPKPVPYSRQVLASHADYSKWISIFPCPCY